MKNADIAAITELYERYAQAMNHDDLDSFMTVWAEEAIQMAPDATSNFGKAQIRKSMKAFFDQLNFQVDYYGDLEVQVFGDWAFARGTYTNAYWPKEGGPRTVIDGKWLDVLKKGADGSWKIFRDCFNNNAVPKVD